MGSRIFIIALWALVAILLVRACLPAGQKEETAIGAVLLEDFTQPSATEYPLVLENDLLRTEWSARGASCGRVALKKYSNRVVNGAPGPEDQLVLHDSARVLAKSPRGGSADVAHYRKRDAFRLIETSEILLPVDPATGVKPNLDGAEWTVEADAASNRLRFTWDAPVGLRIVKTVSLPQGSYHLEAEVEVMMLDGADKSLLGQHVALRLCTGGGIATTPDPYYRNPWVAAGLSEYGSLEDVEFHFPSGSMPPSRAVAKRWTGTIPFVAEGSKYFLNAIRATSEDFKGAVAEVFFDDAAFKAAAKDVPAGAQVDPSRADFWSRGSIGGSFALRLAGPNLPEKNGFQWYVGPKEKRILDETVYGPLTDLPNEADYGSSWFYKIFLTTYVAPVILALLKAFHFVVGNWGVSIILLTILVRVLVFPVTRHSQVKMAEYSARMQKVKPLLDVINTKHANEPKKKQEETMKIYQQHKMTPPIGGCLPILLQMPVFIGLFAALRSSIDLRLQPFAFWIHDLSVPDALVDFGGPVAGFWPLSGVVALNLLPILMVVLWVLHQRSMPKPTDPQQLQMYKIMAVMPVIFGLVLYNYASGLSLYMITSSAIGILEQKVIRKRWPVPAPAISGTVIPPSGKK